MSSQLVYSAAARNAYCKDRAELSQCFCFLDASANFGVFCTYFFVQCLQKAAK